MKNALRLLVFAALATVFALPSYAQDAAAAQTPAADPCTAQADAKAELYKKFLAEYKGTPEQQKTASATGNEYITKYGSCPSEPDKKITAFIQNWVSKYDKAAEEFAWVKAVNENPAEAFRLGRERTTKNPDDLKTYLQLVAAGLKSAQSGNKSLNAESANAARKALALIEQGKTADSWIPFTSQGEAAPGLNYYLGFFTLESAPAEAAKYLQKSAQSSSSYGKEPTTYDFLAKAYIDSELTPLANVWKTTFEGKEATPESEAHFNKINAVTDRIIDALARATALTPAGAAKTGRMTRLETFYKSRNNDTTTGLNELLANVLSKPLMMPGMEPPPPAASPSTTGANGTATPATNATTPASTTPASATPAAKPTPTPAQKPPRN